MNRHFISTLILLTGLLSLVACTTSTNQTTAPTSQPMKDITPTLINAYKQTGPIMSEGQGDKVNNIYAADALYINAAGGQFNGQAAITKFVNGAKGANVRDMTFTEIKTHKAKSGVYIQSTFSFSMQLPSMTQPMTLTGQRMTLWQKGAEQWKMRVDVWLPNKPANTTTTAMFKTTQGNVLNAWQTGDYKALAGMYSDNATIVLSDGSVKQGSAQTQAFLDLSKKFKVANYKTDLKQGTHLSDTAFFGQTTYAFTMSPAPEKTLNMSGCRLVLWQKIDDAWKMALDFAQPENTSTCSK